MTTNSRIKRQWDVGRIREALAGPGADTRVWVANARVSDEEDGIRFIIGLGWLVDVFYIGGEFAGEGPYPARIADNIGGRGINSAPPTPGCPCQVLVNEGFEDAAPVIIGFLHNQADCSWPETVNTTTIDLAYALANIIKVSEQGLDAQYGGQVRIVQGEGELMLLTAPDASQSFVRGEDLLAALQSYTETVSKAITSIAAATVPPTPQPALNVVAGGIKLVADVTAALSKVLKAE